MTNNAIASTQKTGEGDAFLFDNSGATRNIGILAQQKAQEAAREQQAKQQKDKQDYDTQKQFYDGLSDIKLDLYEKDVPFINGKIDDIIKKVADEKMAGRNPFDISNSDAYVGIRGELGKLQAWAAGSKATKAKVRDLQTALYQDKSGVFDKDKTQAALDAYTAYELPERISLDIQPVQAPFNGQAFLTKNLTPTILKSSLPLQKVYTDKTAQAEAQAQLDNLKVQYTPVVDQFLLSTGRYKPEEIPEQRDKYLESLQFKALYDDKQDVSEAFKAQKQAEDLAIKKARLALDRDKFDFSKTVKETTPTYAFEELGRTILGDGSNTVFNGQPYYDANLGTTNSKGEIIYPTINKIEKRIHNPDGSIDALVSLNTPSIDVAGNVVFERKDIKVNAFDKEGNPTYQNSNLYNSIQEYATKKGKSYANISGQEVGSGKPNVTPTTAKNNPGFKGNNNNQNPTNSNSTSSKKSAPQNNAAKNGGTWTEYLDANSKQKPYFSIIDPRTGKALGNANNEDEAKKAQAKGYNIVKSNK
jgi:hypothetical protein